MFLRLRLGVRSLQVTRRFAYSSERSPHRDAASEQRSDLPELKSVNWKAEKLFPKYPIRFTDSEITVQRTPAEIDDFYKSAGISVDGQDPPKPILTFDEMISHQPLKKVLTAQQFEKPTPIQSIAWPIEIRGRDLIGNVHTGSGKTLAFVLPAIQHIQAQPIHKKGEGPSVLILSPTRELAEQTNKCCQLFGHPYNINSTIICGGMDKWRQVEAISRGSQIYAATPGRLIDFLDAGIANMKRMTFLVIDEADRMLDMGFELQLRNILKQLRPDRQTSMWSATWPDGVSKLAKDFISNPVRISELHQALAVNTDITHDIQYVQVDDKSEELFKVLSTLEITDQNKVLIFCNRKSSCEDLMSILKGKNITALALHGDKAYRERQFALKEFEKSYTKILIATDVASRGLDLKNVNTVINYDMPADIESYLHRCGRTGRAGHKGRAITLFTAQDSKVANELIKMLKKTQQVVPSQLEPLARIGRSSRSPQYNSSRSQQSDRSDTRTESWSGSRNPQNQSRGKY